MTPWLRYAIGLGVPGLAVVPTIPLLSRMTAAPFGLPIAVVWLFGCIPLTSACLAICWFAHDRFEAPDEWPPGEWPPDEPPPG